MYGQTFQLVHLETNSYVTVERESAELHKDCLKISLTKGPSTIFTFMPCYKYKIEGEPIRYEDHVKIWTKKLNLYLNVGKTKKHFDGRNEVNMSSVTSVKWKLRKYSSFEYKQDIFKSGDHVRIQHKEKDGYLMLNEHEKVLLCPSDQLEKYITHTVFEVEMEDPTKGGMLNYEGRYKLRHISTGKYLCTKNSKDSDEEELEEEEEPSEIEIDIEKKEEIVENKAPKEEKPEWVISVTDTGLNDVWSLKSSNFTKENLVNMDSYFSLYEMESSLYIHLNQNKLKKSEKQQFFSGRREFNEEDVFTFKKLDIEESHDLLFIQNCIYPIESFIRDLTESDIKEAQNILKNNHYMNNVISCFGNLIKYCTNSDQKDEDLLKREGLPYPKRQQALREKNIIDFAMACVSIPFDQKYLTEEELLDPKHNYKSYFKLIRYVYKFIYLVTKENSINKEYMLKFFEKIQSQVEWSYHNGQVIADAMSGVIKNNRKLIETISKEQIIYFIDCLEKSKIPQIFIGLLSALCNIEGESVSKNQDIITKTIFEGKNPDTLIGNVIVPINENSQLIVYLKGTKISLKEILMRNDYVALLQENIKLIAQLCYGRNEYTQTIIKKSTKLEINNTIYFINNDQVPPEIKSNLIKFLLNCHINTNTFGNKPLFTLTRKNWIKYDPKYKSKSNAFLETKKPPKTTFKASKEMVVKYLSGIQTLDVSKKGTNEFIYSVVIMAKQLFQNGAYTFKCNSKNEEFENLLQLFYNLLIGEKDRRDGFILIGQERFDKSEGSIIISKIRVEILAIFDLCFEIMKENRVSKIMAIYKATESNQQAKVEEDDSEESEEEEEIDYKSGDREKFVGDVLQKTDLSNIIKGDKSLNDILLDLSKYEDDELSISALQFLFKLNSQNSELKNLFGKLELLVSYSMGEVYDKITGSIPKINKLVNSRIDESIISNAKETIQILMEETIKNGAVGQRLLRNSNIPFMLMEALKLKIPKDLQKLIYEFTIIFLKNNQENQLVMYQKYFSFLISKIGQGGIIIDTIIEMLSNNSRVCSLIEEIHIQHIIDTIAEKGYNSDYLRLLRVIVSNNETARRNREMVTNNLLERKKDVIIMFEDDEGLKERNELIEKKDHLNFNTNSKLRYHIELLELLALCAQGQILSVEIKLQYITNFDEIILHILDKSTIPEILHPLMKYFDEVYVYVDKDRKTEKINIHTPNFWKLLAKISADLEKFIRKDPLISPSYILNTIIPFLSHYFEVKFPDIVSSLIYEQINIFETLLVRLILISDKIAFPSHKKKIMDILKVVLDMNIPKLKERIEITYSHKKDFKVVMVREKPVLFEKEDKIIESFLNFVNTLEPTFKKGEELKLLAQKFENEVHYLDQLIFLLSKISKLPPNYERNQVLLKGIQILDKILDSNEDNQKSEEELLDTRNRLATKQVPELLIDLICSKDNDIVEYALDVAIKQFDQGNKAAQKAIFNYFKKQNDGAFFQAIKTRIKQSMVEIKLRKDFFKKLERQKDKTQVEKFKETGFIRKILKLLQLFCEGHNSELQNYLRAQEDSFQNTNILIDILDYLFAAKKYINYSNISIAVQCFNFITESIQGPCIDNQLFFNNIQLYFMINEILQNDFKEKSLLRSIHAVILKKSIMILLNSIVGESMNEEILELMNSSIDFKVIVNNLEKIIERRNNREKHIQEIIEEVSIPGLYKTVEEDSKDIYIEKIRDKVLEEEEELAYQYLFFLNTFIDNGLGNGLTNLGDKFKEFEENIGRIEVLRENKIETVYFKIPELCKNLSENTKKEFIEDSCDGSTPQEKVRKVLSKSNKFQKEMEHSDYQKTNGILKVVEPLSRFKNTILQTLLIYFGLIVAFFINLLIFLTYARMFKVSNDSEIPIPGISSPSSFAKETAFADTYSEDLFIVLSLIHLVLSLAYLVGHIIFSSSLYVKLSYPDDYKEITTESPFKKKLEHYARYVFYLIKDLHLWFYLIYILFIILALVVSPLFYCFHLFELIYRSKTLQYVLKSIYLRWDVLVLTALLLLATIWCFTTIYFNIFNEDFFIKNDDTGTKEFICDTMFRCYLSIIGFGLRAEGFWEDIFDPSTNFGRLFVDLLFWIVIVLVLMNIVFGTILESFAQLRETAEDTELEMHDRCFVCDIRKNRFDVKANEGIQFDDHVNREHSVWNYVYFFVHLMKKEKTEYTGMEQYIYELVMEKDISFFPIQRSRMLEKSENKKEV